MDCCDPGAPSTRALCRSCGAAGRNVEWITVKSLLTARALERADASEYRFCGSPGCDVVYFTERLAFRREDVRVPAFPKEPPGARVVCYCFEIVEGGIDAETESRIRAHVSAGRCACEIKNPEGRCCLGNLRSLR
ncbi:MAG: putative iron-sulfur cluster-binding metallochaperone [Vicinamibacteria bacterium]